MVEMSVEEMSENCDFVSQKLKIMAHPKRLMILCVLIEGHKSVGELEKLTNISQSQVSQFLKLLRSDKMVDVEKEGNFSYYKIADPKIQKLVENLHSIFCSKSA